MVARTVFTIENQPENRRGKSFKTKLIESLQRKGITEEGFIDLLVDKAITEGGEYLKELLKRYNPPPKQEYQLIEFEFDPTWSHVEKASAIMNAVSNGHVAPDVGVLLIEGLSKMLGIEETTELAKRLEAIEKILNEKATNS